MARNASRLKLGYYPLAPEKVSAFVAFSNSHRNARCSIPVPGRARRCGRSLARHRPVDTESNWTAFGQWKQAVSLTKLSKEASSILIARSNRTRCCT